MNWYYLNFDPNWVTCRNFRCRSQFSLKRIVNKRKCPVCRFDRQGNIKLSKKRVKSA